MTLNPPEAAHAEGSAESLYRAAHYEGERSSTGAARQLAEAFVKNLSTVWVAPASEEFAHDVLLVVSELLTNATRHAPGPCLLELEAHPAGVTVTMWDSSIVLPHALAHDPARVGGHGIEIIQRLCTDVRAECVPVGKRIRATVPLRTVP